LPKKCTEAIANYDCNSSEGSEANVSEPEVADNSKVFTPHLGRSKNELRSPSEQSPPRILETTEDDQVMFMASPFDDSPKNKVVPQDNKMKDYQKKTVDKYVEPPR
jgi:hypothetical protein